MSQIVTTAGNAGIYMLGAASANVTLFTTPNIPNAIFIVSLVVTNGNTLSGVNTANSVIKLTYGPNTPCIIRDDVSPVGTHIQWSWAQMIIQ